MSASVRNVLTIDVEDWYQGLDLPAARWSSFERRLSIGLEFVLNTLAAHNTRATFFVLGVTASEHREWVRRIVAAGHELGTHGWSHTPIYRQSRETFRAELCRSLTLLQDLSGQRVLGHRAALFSLTARSLWALDEVRAAGLCYDSSIFPVHNYRYGMPRAPRWPHRVAGALWELPVSTLRVGGLNVPLGGGFYMRFWPYTLVRWGIANLNRRGQSAVFYFHPWEFDAAQPRSAEPHWLARATHYYRLQSTRASFERLLRDFRWTTAREFLNRQC